MYNITNKRKNKINLPEIKGVTIYDNTLQLYIKELEEKINIMKKAYIKTLIEKHFEKDENKKLEIILKANISKKRNDVKKIFKQIMDLIKTKLKEQNQKFYYLIILKILNQYKSINDDEIKQMMKLYRQKRANKKYIIQSNKNNFNNYKYNNDNNDNNNNGNNDWINQQNSKKGIIFKIFTVLIPLAYIINYGYSNFKV